MQPWRTTSRPSPGSVSSGFTLVELLVSTAVLGLLLVFLAQVANVVAKTWTDSQGRAERRQNGRALVDFIGRDLRGAALPVNSGTPGNVPNLQFVLNPPTVAAQDRNPCALFWQAPIGTSTAVGDMAVLGYLVRWDNSGSNPRAALCRLFLNPGDPYHRIYLPGFVDSWVDSDVLNAAAPGTRAGSYRGLFAENVIGFWAKCLDVKGNVVTNLPGNGFSSRKDYSGRNGSDVTVTYKAPVLPTSVEVSIVLLDSRAASKVTPFLQDVLTQVVRDSDDADSCIRALQSDSTFRPITQGATAHTLRVYLENGP